MGQVEVFVPDDSTGFARFFVNFKCKSDAKQALRVLASHWNELKGVVLGRHLRLADTVKVENLLISLVAGKSPVLTTYPVHVLHQHDVLSRHSVEFVDEAHLQLSNWGENHRVQPAFAHKLLDPLKKVSVPVLVPGFAPHGRHWWSSWWRLVQKPATEIATSRRAKSRRRALILLTRSGLVRPLWSTAATYFAVAIKAWLWRGDPCGDEKGLLVIWDLLRLRGRCQISKQMHNCWVLRWFLNCIIGLGLTFWLSSLKTLLLGHLLTIIIDNALGWFEWSHGEVEA